MKKIKKVFYLMLIILTISATSCKKDKNNDNEEEQVTLPIIGNYSGELEYTSIYYSSHYIVVVDKVNNNTVRIIPSSSDVNEYEAELKKIGNDSYTLKNPVNGIEVLFYKDSDGIYKLKYEYDVTDGVVYYLGKKTD